MGRTNKQLIQARFAKAAASYNDEATIQRQIAEKMITLIKEHASTTYESLFEVGCGTGIFSRLLLRHIRPERMIMNDICPEMEKNLTDITGRNHTFLCGDAEILPFPEAMDIIASCSTLQWFARPNDFFRRCHAALNEGGLLAFSTFGKENMREVASIAGTGLFYPSGSELERELLLMDYDILHFSEEIRYKSFDTPLNVLHHLKRTGVTGIQSQSWTKGTLTAFCSEYNQRYNNGNSVSLTYHPIYIIAKKKTV